MPNFGETCAAARGGTGKAGRGWVSGVGGACKGQGIQIAAARRRQASAAPSPHQEHDHTHANTQQAWVSVVQPGRRLPCRRARSTHAYFQTLRLGKAWRVLARSHVHSNRSLSGVIGCCRTPVPRVPAPAHRVPCVACSVDTPRTHAPGAWPHQQRAEQHAARSTQHAPSLRRDPPQSHPWRPGWSTSRHGTEVQLLVLVCHRGHSVLVLRKGGRARGKWWSVDR